MENNFKAPSKKCENCETVFVPKRHWQRFCSDRCRMQKYFAGRTNKIQELQAEIERLTRK